MVSAEYGWSDKKINNLTLRRFRQITASINRRKFWEIRRDWDRTAWQTRQLASFTAAGYFSKDNSEAVDAAQSLAWDEIDAAVLEEQSQKRATSGVQVKEKYLKEPQPGSFERFMGSMGNPKQWAGR